MVGSIYSSVSRRPRLRTSREHRVFEVRGFKISSSSADIFVFIPLRLLDSASICPHVRQRKFLYVQHKVRSPVCAGHVTTPLLQDE